MGILNTHNFSLNILPKTSLLEFIININKIGFIMNYFYHESIKNYTIAMLDLFNDIKVPRYDSSGIRISDQKVPIKFGSKESAYMVTEQTIDGLHTGNINTLPRMALSFTSMERVFARDTNSKMIINRKKSLDKDSNGLIEEYHYNSVSYDFSYTLYIATRTFTDATIIIEQIAPLFRPDLSLKIQELDIQSEPTTVPVKLGDFNIELPEDLTEDDIRIIQVDVSLIVQGNLYLPITDSKLIKELEINIAKVDEYRDIATEEYAIDATSIITTDADTTIDYTEEELKTIREEAIIETTNKL